MLRVCSVKAYWDGALGSRGARLLADYTDRAGHRGISGEGYGFDQDLVSDAIGAGFQVAIHAIGDAGNRETLDYFERVFERHAEARSQRHRVEHAQVLHPSDIDRFASLELIASMQPPHVAEDQAWAEERLGAARTQYAYAWRSLIQAGVPVVFNSDLAGSDHDILYGLHSAVTRRSKPTFDDDGTPTNTAGPGFVTDQAVTMEEALRAYSVNAAFASFLEDHTGTLRVGALADLTVLQEDPLTAPLSLDQPATTNWWENDVQLTMVGGEVVYRRE